MDEERTKPTVYFDGSCPLCRAEIGYYRGKTEDDVLRFVDVSKIGVETPEGLTRQQALERFHVLTSDGRVLSGAAAFVEVWSQVPGWRWAARAASLPPVLAVLELGYRMFLPIRPVISRLVKRVIMAKSAGNRA
jgi:predicted DCC family thiol-disulfide oxidoreductase YuxK